MKKKLELYKVPGYDFLYLDENGEPYSVNKRKLNKRELPNGYKEYYLITHEYGKQRNEVHKNIVARTFLDSDDKYVYHKDGNIENYHPDNLEVSSERNEDYYVTCPVCGRRIRKSVSGIIKNKMCGKCKHELERQNRILNKSNKRKKLYEYIINNKDCLRMSSKREQILEHLKEGKSDSEIARELGISRQAVSDNIKRMEVRILHKQLMENKKDEE